MSAVTVLGIESSCDETSAAVVSLEGDALRVRSCVTASQDDLHAEYRGVVPEIASRAHLESILPVMRAALAQADLAASALSGVAAATRPGLIGSLLVGSSAGKGFAWGRSLPFVGVDHVAAHLVATLLDAPPVKWPAVGLVASGGHTSLFALRSALDAELLGATVADAAGEAFDKAAALLDLGYPGGARLDAVANTGNSRAIDLPVASLPGLDFSFSGVKTALALATKRAATGVTREDFAASFRRAVIAQIARNLDRALGETQAHSCLVGGGVAANTLLRSEAARICAARGCELRLAAPRWCTDNAAMIAGVGALRIAAGERDPWDLAPMPLSTLARKPRVARISRA
jgi:N6-L-threonylcarbamoyladenine synthase